jgi:uncharacterized protein (TIGR03086 family)
MGPHRCGRDCGDSLEWLFVEEVSPGLSKLLRMSEACDRYVVIGAGFTERVRAVPPSRRDEPSPCTDWTAREVVKHVINTHARVLASLNGRDPVLVSGEDDLAAAWSMASSAVRDALQDPTRAGIVVRGMFGEQPFESLVGRLLCTDTLIHTWDLARATGQDESLDPGAVAKAIEFLAPIDDAIRRPGGFGPKIDSPPDAGNQTRLLNFTGRST